LGDNLNRFFKPLAIFNCFGGLLFLSIKALLETHIETFYTFVIWIVGGGIFLLPSLFLWFMINKDNNHTFILVPFYIVNLALFVFLMFLLRTIVLDLL